MNTQTIERPEVAPLEEWPLLSWAARIDAAEARGSFNEEDTRDAFNWNTCAIGEHFNLGCLSSMEASLTLSDRVGVGSRLHEAAISLGRQFPAAVVKQDFVLARATLAQIEVLPTS